MPASPLTFLKFCERVGVKLTPAQRIIGAISYDGIQPYQLLDQSDRDLARVIYGDIDNIPRIVRSVALNLCGARGGKSYTLIALRIVHLALTVNLDSLAPNERASGVIVAPDLKLAEQTFRFALGAAQHPSVSARIIGKPGKNSFIIGREGGRKVIIECLPASKGGAALRARYYVGAGLDEFAFFRGADGAVINDKDIFDAVAPRILPGGQVMICSTAWAGVGLMYEMFTKNFGKPGTCLAARASTVLLNPEKAEEVAFLRKRDPVNAEREFDCQFMDASSAVFFSHDAIMAAVDPRLVLPLRPRDYPGCEILIGADLGFRRDSSTLVVVYKLADGTYTVAEIVEMRPKPGNPLKPSEVVERFATVAKQHECTWIVGDIFAIDVFQEELAKHGLSYVAAPGGSEGKAVTHMTAKTLLHGGKVRLPDHGRLLDQMKSLVGKPTAGGGLSLQSPRSSLGGHGDILSAWVLAISQRSGQKGSERIPEKTITLEEAIQRNTRLVWERYEDKRKEALAAQQEAEGPMGYASDAVGNWDAYRNNSDPWS